MSGLEEVMWMFLSFVIPAAVLFAYMLVEPTTPKCKQHQWERQPDGQLRCARCKQFSGEIND